MARGYQGAMMKALGAEDITLTVTGVEDLAPHYRRIRFVAPGVFDSFVPEPASWIRLWVPDPGEPERELQRGYTYVDADPEADTFALDFVLHEPAGPASAWAAAATPGATVRATTFASTKFTPPDPEPAGYLLIGDLASLPGIREVVAAVPDRLPVELYLEQFHPEDRDVPLPSHPRLRITWVPHRPGGAALAEAIEHRDWSDWYVWAGAEKQTVKLLRTGLRDVHGFPKADLKLAPYWIVGKPMGGRASKAAPRAEGHEVDPGFDAPEVVEPTVIEPTVAGPDGPGADASAPSASAPSAGAPDGGPTAAATGAAGASSASDAARAEGPDVDAAPGGSGRRWRSQAGRELLAPLKGVFRLAAVAQVIVALIELVPLVLLVEAARRMLNGAEPSELRPLAVTALVVLGVGTTLTATLVAVMHVVDARFALTVKQRLVAKLARLPLGWFSDRTSGTVRQLVVDDTASLHYLVTHAVLDLVAAITTPLVVLVYLFVVDARLAGLLLVPILVYGVMVWKMAYVSAEKIAEHGRWAERVGAEAVAYLEGATVVRTYGRGEGVAGGTGFHRTLADYTSFVHEWQVPLGRQKAIAALAARPTTFLWVIVAAGTFLVTADTMSPTTLLTFLVFGVTFGPKLLGAAYGAATYRQSMAAAQRVGLALTEPELTVRGQAVAEPEVGRGPAVALRDVTFSYRAGQPVLHGVDLDLPAGSFTALVGPSGSGKSTLAALLARFHDPDSGSVEIGGIDLRSVPPDALHRLVGTVFQDVRTVHGTIRDNIALARPDATDAEVRTAAEAAQLADRIDRLPRGYDSVVGVDVRLSGGEAQRLSIARTLLADPPVLVLDEATAFADPESERRVQEALSTLVRGRTVLVIAHRLPTIVDADSIVVLEDGRIVERGRHAELLAAAGRYADLWEAAAVPTTGGRR